MLFSWIRKSKSIIFLLETLFHIFSQKQLFLFLAYRRCWKKSMFLLDETLFFNQSFWWLLIESKKVQIFIFIKTRKRRILSPLKQAE